jgi:hypothetical protein
MTAPCSLNPDAAIGIEDDVEDTRVTQTGKDEGTEFALKLFADAPRAFSGKKDRLHLSYSR